MGKTIGLKGDIDLRSSIRSRMTLGRMSPDMPAPIEFTYKVRKNGEIVISHHGRLAVTLRGRSAAKFLTQLESHDEQQVMARVTGNYKRGNERPQEG